MTIQVLSTLLESGFRREAFGSQELEAVTNILETAFAAEKNLVGFGELSSTDGWLAALIEIV